METITYINNAQKFTEKKRKCFPMLSKLLIKGGKVWATDLETYYSANIEADGISATIDANPLVKAKFSCVKFDQKGDRIQAVNGTRSMSLAAASAEGFPEWPVLGDIKKQFTMQAESLFSAINSVAFCASTDDTRFNICGVYWHDKGMVATDGHRLAYNDRPFPLADTGLIIHRDSIKKLLPLLKKQKGLVEVTLYKGSNWNDFLCVDMGNESILIKLVDGQYPDYRQVIPSSDKIVIEVEADQLKQAAESIRHVCTEKSKAIKLALIPDDKGETTLNLSASSPEHGQARSICNVVSSRGLDALEIGISAHYLIDAMKANKGDLIELRFNGSASPIVISPSNNHNYKQVIMPMRFE